MKASLKIGIIIGTRPEAIKLIPVYYSLNEITGIHPVIICTGQHSDLVLNLFEEFKLVPNYNLSVMTHNQTLSSLSSALHQKLSALFCSEPPDMVIVQGDTTSGMIGAIEAFYAKIPVAHVEAGLRTSSKYNPFPEEINRRIISQIAELHFPPTQTSFNNLVKENLEGKMVVTGNTVIDSLLLMKDHFLADKTNLLDVFSEELTFDHIVLVTAHRRENFGNGLEQITNALRALAIENPNICFVIPVHPNPNVKDVMAMLSDIPNIKLHKPFSYSALVFILSKSFMVLTDSGGIQEEAPSLNIPVLVMRNETERMEMIDAGCGFLVGNNTAKIIAHFNLLLTDSDVYNKMANGKNPYGDGYASETIAKSISDFLHAQ